MKKKKYLILIAALSISASFLLNGCGQNNTSASSSSVELSAEVEAQTGTVKNATLTDGNLQLTSRWYQADNSKLANAKLSVKADGKEIASGTIDANGSLSALTVPANKMLTCTLTDAKGTVLAESAITFRLSADYTTFSIYPTDSEKNEQTVEVPAAKTNISAAMFVSKNKTIDCANLSSTPENTTTTKKAADPANKTSQKSTTSQTQTKQKSAK